MNAFSSTLSHPVSLVRKFFVATFLSGMICNAGAQTLTATGTLSGVQDISNPSLFDYTLTLNNSASSTVSLETFWYAWIPGQDYLPTSPTSITGPAGWTDIVTHGGSSDGYAIQWKTSTTADAIAAGSSGTFTFQSTDSPATLAGNSPFYTSTPIGTSFVYQGAPFSGASDEFVVQSSPEPSSLGLLLLGLCSGAVCLRWRRLRFSRAA